MSPHSQQLSWQSPLRMHQIADPLAATDTREDNGFPGVPIDWHFDLREVRIQQKIVMAAVLHIRPSSIFASWKHSLINSVLLKT